MPLITAPIPLNDPIAAPRRREFRSGPKVQEKDPFEGLITDPWVKYITDITVTVDNAPTRVNSISKTNQIASIGATDVSAGNQPGGLYEIKFYVRITQAASVSSSLQVTLDWTDGGVSPAQTFPAITGNTVTTIQSSGLPQIHVDSGTPIRYATTYVSVGGTPMKYRLDVTLLQVAG